MLEEVRVWQNRPLDPVYPVIFFDALRVKIGDEGLVRNKAVDVALALNSEGEKEGLGLWIEQTAGAKFWLKVMNELKTRGVNDVLIAVVDRLKACPCEGGGLCRGDRHGLSADHGAVARRLAGALALLLRRGEFRLDLGAQACVLGQAEQEIHAVVLAPRHQRVAGKARIGTQQNAHPRFREGRLWGQRWRIWTTIRAGSVRSRFSSF